MLSPTVSVSLVFLMLAAGAAQAQDGARLVYTRHALMLDVRDLDLSRAADRHILDIRIADAANEVCGGRPDRDTRYNKVELAMLVPAYEKCRSDAIASTYAALQAPAQVVAGK